MSALSCFAGKVFATAITAVACTMSLSCGWEKKLEFIGPRNTSVEIWQPWPANGWGLRVRLCDHGRCDVIYSKRGDMFLFFADVYWAPDGRYLAVITCGEPYLRLAYDRLHKKPVPFSDFKKQMQEQIRHDYPGFGTEDPISWACTDDATRRFSASHPGFGQR